MLKQQLISFSRRLLLFLFTIAVADQLIGYVLRTAYFSQRQGFSYQSTQAIRDTKAGTLVLGSSRALNIVDPAVIRAKLGDSCFNAGMEGQSVLYQYAVLQAILQRYRPHRVILTVDAGNFLKEQKSYDRLSRLLPYYHAHPEIRETVQLKGAWEPLKLWSAIYPYNSTMLEIMRSLAGKNSAEAGVDGFIGLKRTVSGDPLTMDFTQNRVMDTVKLNRFRRILQDCRKAGVRIYVVCPPYRIHANGVDTSLSLARSVSVSEGVPYLDFYADSGFTSRREWFADFRHLNITGAAVFTDTLAARIRMLEQGF